MDVSSERHSADIGHRGLQSINRARTFLNRELLKGTAPCLRRAKSEEDEGEDSNNDEAGEDDDEGGHNSARDDPPEMLRQDIESAGELFFVVEKRPRDGRQGEATSTSGGGTGGDSAIEATIGEVRRSLQADDSSSGISSNGESAAESRGGSRPAGAGQEEDRYSVPYWAILRVGELTNDAGEEPEPWPLYDASVGGSGGGSGAHAGGERSEGSSSFGPWGGRRVGAALSRPSDTPSSQVHRPANGELDSVGYRIVVINVKVSVHHPRGSEVATRKDAVIDGIRRVRGDEIDARVLDGAR